MLASYVPWSMSLFRNKNEKTQAANPEWTGCHLTVPSGPGSPAAGHPGSEADRLSAETGLLFPQRLRGEPEGRRETQLCLLICAQRRGTALTPHRQRTLDETTRFQSRLLLTSPGNCWPSAGHSSVKWLQIARLAEGYVECFRQFI